MVRKIIAICWSMSILNFSRRLESALLTLPRPNLLADWGCGNGEMFGLYRRVFPDARLIGIDVDLNALARQPHAHVILADITRLPFARQAIFDAVIVRHPDVDRHPQTWQQGLEVAANALRPHGWLLISTYTRLEMRQVKSWLPANLCNQPITATLEAPNLAGSDTCIELFTKRAN